MSDSVLLVETPMPGCALLTLNRPTAMNALSRALRAEIAEAVNRLSQDESVRVLVVTGAGKAFCAGLDLKELATQVVGVMSRELDPVGALLRFPGPVIGAVNGVAITGGLELAMACDLLIASTQARFADTHARVRVIPGWGLSQRLSRQIGISRAKEMSFSGNFVGAEQAERWGLVNRVVSPEQLLPQALALASDMLTIEPEMMRQYKRLIDDGYGMSFKEAMQLESEASQDWAAALNPADVERRRHEVRARGQQQKDL